MNGRILFKAKFAVTAYFRRSLKLHVVVRNQTPARLHIDIEIATNDTYIESYYRLGSVQWHHNRFFLFQWATIGCGVTAEPFSAEQLIRHC